MGLQIKAAGYDGIQLKIIPGLSICLVLCGLKKKCSDHPS